MEELVQLAGLIRIHNDTEREMAAIIGRPGLIGHLGEFIAARVFNIELDPSASRKSIDGYFCEGPLAGRSVNIKWYRKQESMLDITPLAPPDYYLVMTGPRSGAMSSRGTVRPLLLERVYLFDAPALVETLAGYGVKIGVATSVRQHLWRAAELYPQPRNPLLRLSEEQRTLLELFAAPAGR